MSSKLPGRHIITHDEKGRTHKMQNMSWEMFYSNPADTFPHASHLFHLLKDLREKSE